MKKNFSFLIVLVFINLRFCFGQHYWIKNLNIVDVEKGQILKNYHLEIDQGKIKSITNKSRKVKGDVKAGESKFVIPGLWDMHVHLSMVGDASMPLFLHYGVTGVRDMGGDMGIINTYKETSSYPTIVSAGAILESPKFYQIISLLLGEEISKTRVPYGNPDHIGQLVDSLLTTGSDFIKIRTSVGQEEFEALGKACKERGINFSGHIDQNIDLLAAVKSGIGSIEHSEFFNVLKLDSLQQHTLIQSVAAERPNYTPTLIATKNHRMTPLTEVVAFVEDSLSISFPERSYISSKLLEYWMLHVQMAQLEGPMVWDYFAPIFIDFGSRLAKYGLPLLAGTDVGLGLVIPGKGLHEELELLVEYFGISNLEALQSATLNPARFLKRTNEGVVKEGALANLVLLDENPLENISHTQKIAAVIQNGKIYNKEDRNHLLENIKQNVQKERKTYKNNLLDYYNRSLKQLMEN